MEAARRRGLGEGGERFVARLGRGGCGPGDVVAAGGREPRRSRRAGHLARVRARAGRRGPLVGGAGRRGRGRPGRRGAAAALGGVVGPDGGAPGRRRGPAGHVLGHRGGAPAAVRRLAGRSRLGLGPAARPGRPTLPASGPLDLFAQGDGGDGRRPGLAPDGHLRPEWIDGGWADGPERLARWAELALDRRRAAAGGAGRAGRPADGPAHGPRPSRRPSCCAPSCRPTGCRWTGRSPSRSWPRSSGPGRAARPRRPGARAARDAEVLRHAPAGATADLRSPAPGARRCWPRSGVDVPDTRAWRLRDAAGRPSARRRAAGLAQGRADRHHLRLRAGWTSTSAPTVGCAARGPAPTARRAG